MRVEIEQGQRYDRVGYAHWKIVLRPGQNNAIAKDEDRVSGWYKRSRTEKQTKASGECRAQ